MNVLNFRNYPVIYNTKAFQTCLTSSENINHFIKRYPNTENISRHGFWVHYNALRKIQEDTDHILLAKSAYAN